MKEKRGGKERKAMSTKNEVDNVIIRECAHEAKKNLFQPFLSSGVLCHTIDRMERWSRGRSSCVRARSEGLQAAVGQSPQVVLLWSMVMLLKTSFRNCPNV